MRRIFGAILLALAAELAIIVWLSQRFGFSVVLLQMVASATLGVIFFQQVKTIAQSKPPAHGKTKALAMATGAVRTAGALALVLPGMLSDAVGLLLWVPPLTHWLARRVAARAEAAFDPIAQARQNVHWHWQWPPPPGPSQPYDIDILPNEPPHPDSNPDDNIRRLPPTDPDNR